MPDAPLNVGWDKPRRDSHILAALAPGGAFALWCLVHAVDPASASFVLFMGVGLLISAIVLLSSEYEQRQGAALVDEAARQGFESVPGALTSGLARWPAGGLPFLASGQWTFTAAFRNASDAVRIFAAMQYRHEGPSGKVSGAVIHVPDANFPAFSIGRARRGILNRTPQSAVEIVSDPTFATEFCILTAQPRALGKRLGARFADAWRATGSSRDDWNLEGNGDWVVIWSEQELKPFHFAGLASRFGVLAAALRHDVDTQA